jgi:hypothetical protein
MARAVGMEMTSMTTVTAGRQAAPVAFFRRLWAAEPLLTATGGVLLLALLPMLAGLWLDPRTITGAPAWMKPAKFAISTALYTFTLAWVFLSLREWPRLRRVVGRLTAAVLVGEVALIALQAARGRVSHFNVATPLDAAIFSIMGTAILTQTLASVAVAVALWRQPFADRARGWALRLGLTLSIVGASTGGLMVAPTAAQLVDARATHQMSRSGAHTVGAPDGGPGLPGVGWSTRHGDVRVPHFMGLHALQALPLLAWLVRRKPEALRVKLTLAGAALYALVFALLLAQALMGRPVIALG